MANLPLLIAGIIAVVVGALLILKRSSFNKISSDAQRATFGRAGDKVANRSSSGGVGIVGGGFAAIGLIMIVLALTGANV